MFMPIYNSYWHGMSVHDNNNKNSGWDRDTEKMNKK